MSQSKKILLFGLLLLVFFVLLFHNYIFHLPEGIHSWAQGDRLGLAYGFYENGMHFFKPSTLSQFSKTGGITGVEFPIQAYLAALVTQPFGKSHLSLIFRLLDTVIIYSCLIFIFKIALSFTKRVVLATLPPLILLLSPCFLNYTCSYMPDTVSACLAIVGIGYYLQCWLQSKVRKRYTAIFLLILASLIKTSSGLYFVGFIGFDIFMPLFQGKKKLNLNLPLLVSASLGAGIITIYIFYNNYLNKEYDSSLFLMAARPISLNEARYFLFSRFPHTWAKEYFILPVYPLFGILAASIYFSKEKLRIFMPLLLILTIGILAVLYLMGHQLIDHDYYIIPIVFPFIVLHLFLFIIGWEQKCCRWNFNLKALPLIYLALLVFSFLRLQARLSPDYPDFSKDYNTEWMVAGAHKLDSLNIKKNEIIVVLDESPPNLPLIYFDRKGYVIDKQWWGEDFESAYNFMGSKQLFYGIIQTTKYNRIVQKDTTFNEYFCIQYQDKNMILFTRKSNENEKCPNKNN